MNQQGKVFLGILILVLLAAGAFGAYYLYKSKPTNPLINSQSATVSPSPLANETSALNTYTNKQNRYSIQYPGNWVVTADNEYAVQFDPKNTSEDQQGAITIQVSPQVSSKENLPFEEYVKIAASQEIQGHESLISIEKIQSTETIGYKTVWSMAAGSPSPYKTSTITYFPSTKPFSTTQVFVIPKPENMLVYDQVIRTFQLQLTGP